MWLISICPTWRNCSPARWIAVPSPAEANVTSPGFCLASATSPSAVFAGTSGCTTSTSGDVASSETAAKSFFVS